ncbi:MAG: CCA tRNA nucleotidyltransferase [Aquisalinus sp.]|nr:CCA tRNA nucleotidyltransferase [Aquisalinus sp.]
MSNLPVETLPDTHKADFDWISHPSLTQIMQALENHHAGSAMFVGGCVRDSLIGNPPQLGQDDTPTDIDIATRLTPDETITALKTAGLKAIPTGYDHGTITAVADGLVAEITTLRADIETDGRHATVAYTTDWQQDWQRRDFTINAMYLTPDGKLFDPAGGRQDLQKEKVAFIGDAHTRIREDYLRILRFYRFSARYARDLDQTGHAACAALASGLQQISAERITMELRKILAGPRLPFVLTALQDAGILAAIMPQPADIATTSRAFDLARQTGHASPELYLAALWDDPQEVTDRLRLSNAQSQRMTAASTNRDWLATQPDDTRARELLYRHGTEALQDASLLLGASDHEAGLVTDRWQAFFTLPDRWIPPACPFSAANFIARGLPIGPAIGKALTAAEQDWIAADYPQDRDRIDEIIHTTVETVQKTLPSSV